MAASTGAAPRWVEYSTDGTANGRVDLTGVITLKTLYGTAPTAMICQTGGLVLLADGGATARAITAIAGVMYPLYGMTTLTASGTTADNILFLYNNSDAIG